MPDSSAPLLRRFDNRGVSPAAASNLAGAPQVAALLPQSRLSGLPMGYMANKPLPPIAWGQPTQPGALPPLAEAIRAAERTPQPTAPGLQPARQPAVQRQSEKPQDLQTPLSRPPEIPLTISSPITSTEPASAPQATLPPIQRQPIRDAQPGIPQPPVVQTEGPKAPSKALEADWPRLQNILRKHQEGEATRVEKPGTPSHLPDSSTPESAASPAETGQAAPRVQTQRAPETPAAKIPAESRRMPKPVITEFDSTASTPAEVKSVQKSPAQPIPAIPPMEQAPLQEPLAVPQEGEASTPPGALSDKIHEKQAVEVLLKQEVSKPAVQRSEQAAPQRQSVKSTPAGLLEGKHPREEKTPLEIPAGQNETIAAGESREWAETWEAGEPEMEPGDALQPLPLDAVWPVQRQELYPPDAPTQVMRSLPQVDDAEEPAEAPPDDAPVRNVLQSIAVEQPTDSHVELITPRKPRPKAAAMAVQKVAEGTPDEIDQKSPQNIIEDEFSKTAVSHEIAPGAQSLQKAPEETGVSESQPSKTSKPLPAVIQKRAAETEMVETEIGPLPADLWQLLGQEPPGKEKPSSIPGAEPTTSQQNIQRVEEKIRQVASMPSPVVKVPAAPPIRQMVQRQEEATATQAPAAEPAPEKGAAAEGGEEKVNTDELAQKVYAQIKRRLMVEWERLRRR